jgi:hypothetical protein
MWIGSSRRFTTRAHSSGTDVRWSLPILFAALTAFIASAGITIVAIDRQSQLLAGVAIFGMLLASLLFVASMWYRRGKVDWRRIEAEQRLWESGPLGRSWLRVRRRLSDLWKI